MECQSVHSHHGRLRSALVFAASFLLLTGENARAQDSVETDRAALVALYNATDGANWTTNTNWLTSEAISDWHGVGTDREGRATVLDLRRNKLSGEIPAELGRLTNLRGLSLSGNQLTGTIPPELGSLTNLRELLLQRTQLTGTIPAELGDLTSLRELYLDRNELSGEIPAELGNLANLRGLYLWDNQLSGEIPGELGDLTNLQLLLLSGNELSGEIPAELGDLTNLWRLWLSGNELSGEIPAELGRLTNLLDLSLGNNELSGAIPAELGRLTNLKSLGFSRNELSGAIPGELGSLANLEWLVLNDNELSGEIPAELGDLANLQFLYIWRNELSGAIPGELGDLTNLEGMYLHENELSGAIPGELGGLANLKDLHLNGNELSGEIPAELGDLTNLKWLNLSQNELSGEIPAELGDLTNLWRLHLSQNELSGEIPAELGGLTNLQWLYLDNNELSGEIPGELGGLTNLWGLHLNGNELRGEAPGELGRLTNLRGLYLHENRLSGPLPLTLSALPQLSRLDIRSTNLCVPADIAFRVWLSTIWFQGDRCDATLNFAHFANGDGITSEMVFVNPIPASQPYSPSFPIYPVLYFYDQEGHFMEPGSVVHVGGDLRIQEDGGLHAGKEIEPLGELTISTHGLGELVRGSVKVVTNVPIGGVLRFDLPGIGVAGVGTGQPVKDAIFPVRRQAGGISTAAAVHNIEEEAMAVTCRLMSGGDVLEEVAIPLEANGQEARYIEGLFTATDTSDFVGLVRCTSPGMFTGVAVELDAGNRIFTTLPVMPVSQGQGEETTLDFAHFANGKGIISEVVLVNLETQPRGPVLSPFHAAIPPIRPALYFYDQGGDLIDPKSVVDLTGDLEVTEDGALTVQTELGSLEELTISSHGRGGVVSGSVKVVSDGPIGGVLRFGLPGIGVAGVGASQPVQDALFPARRQAGRINTAAAIHNLGEEAMGVSCQLMSGGVVLEEVEIHLEANGQEARYIEEVFTATDTSDFVGLVRCTAPEGGMFTGVAVELDPSYQIFTTLPVTPVTPIPERPSRE